MIRSWFAAALTLGVIVIAAAVPAQADDTLPPDFAHLHEIDPGISQDIRYAGANNFIGRPLAGYEAPACILRRDVAMALARVQADLVRDRLGLTVHDCYRPERAVRMMVQWARDGGPDGPGKRFFPHVAKRNLLAGYIGAQSRHSTGTAVDVTLVEAGQPVVAARADPCAPASDGGERIDMGTDYDCLDRLSRTDSAEVTPAQHRWRMLLTTAMTRHGFRNYVREWWHFSFSSVTPVRRYDFPIRERP